jgi:hypothetical protein
VTPEAKDYLDKDQDDLDEARKIAGIRETATGYATLKSAK